MTPEQDIIEGEVVNSQRALVTAPKREIINVDLAVKEWEAYQELTRRLLDDTDYQKIGKSRFKKKSAWRKYARAFNLSCEKVSEEVVRAEDGFPIYARLTVRASDPNGRYQDAEQECHIVERCCPARAGARCRMADWQSHSCCRENCDGRIHFSHPGDLPATAFTRAKNRAIADLIGAGEVSAEEMQGRDEASAPQPQQARRPASVASDNGDASTPTQHKAIHSMLTKRFGGDEKAAWECVKELEPKAVDASAVHVTGLSKQEASALISALNDELVAVIAERR